MGAGHPGVDGGHYDRAGEANPESLVLVEPPLSWVAAAPMVAVLGAGWEPGEQTVGPSTNATLIVFAVTVVVWGGFCGFITWAVCAIGIAMSRESPRVRTWLLGWPFWVATPLALAAGWWSFPLSNPGGGATSGVWFVFAGTGAWALAAAWLMILWAVRLRSHGPTDVEDAKPRGDGHPETQRSAG